MKINTLPSSPLTAQNPQISPLHLKATAPSASPDCSSKMISSIPNTVQTHFKETPNIRSQKLEQAANFLKNIS